MKPERRSARRWASWRARRHARGGYEPGNPGDARHRPHARHGPHARHRHDAGLRSGRRMDGRAHQRSARRALHPPGQHRQRRRHGRGAVLTDFGLSEDVGAWFSVGINAEGAGGWTGWRGEPVVSAWERVAIDVQDGNRSPYFGRAWTPMTVDEVCGLGIHTCE